MGLIDYIQCLLKWHNEGTTNLLTRLQVLYTIMQTDDIVTPLNTATLEAIALRTHQAMTKNIDVTQSLQRDVDTYQRDLDDQMQRMYTQRQQGELMLSALVERIDERFQDLSLYE